MRTAAWLEERIEHLLSAPTDAGTLALLVRRPANGEREVLAEGRLDVEAGLEGDNWRERATSRAVADGRHLDAQVNVMSARMIALLADDPYEQALAGDQLFLDLDLSHANLPAGARIAIGDEAEIEVTAKPHNGCKKFLARFGEDAVAFINSDRGRQLRLRGLNARVVASGVVRPGDTVRVLSRISSRN